jgi:hypothetical protein
MARAKILPPTYKPEAVEDGGCEKPAIKLDGSPETPREMMPKVAQIRTDSEESIEDSRHAQNDGHRAGRQRLQDDKGDAAAVLGHLTRENVSPEHITQAQKALDKVNAKIAAYDAKGTKESGNLPPTLMPMLRDFFRVSTRISNGRGFEDAGTTDTLLPGKDMIETAAVLRDDILAGREALKWITEAPPTREEIASRLRSGFGDAAGLADSRLRGAAGCYFDPGQYDFFIPGGGRANGRFNMWGYEQPAVAVANGLGDIIRISDGFATILAVLGDELIDRMVDKAMAKYDGQSPLTMAERTAKRIEAEERLLELERKHAFWVYAAREKGIRIDHVSEANPFAVLDIVIRK